MNLRVLTYLNYHDSGNSGILVHYKIWKMEIFGSSLAPLLKKIEICVHWVFCGKFNSEQLLLEAFFNILNPYCLQHSTIKWTYFLIPVHNKISKMEIFGVPLAPFLGEIEISVHWVFCGKFNSEQLLFEGFFEIIHIDWRAKLFLKYFLSYRVTFNLFTFSFVSVLAVHGYMVEGLDPVHYQILGLHFNTRVVQYSSVQRNHI